MMLKKEQIVEAISGLGGRLSTKRLTFYRTHIALVVIAASLNLAACGKVLMSKDDIGSNFRDVCIAALLALGAHSGTGYLKKDQPKADGAANESH